MTRATRPYPQSLSVVLPVFNEVNALDALYEQIVHALAEYSDGLEIVFVNDGSTDGSAEKLDQLAHVSTVVKVVHLSRNFGHQAAVQAGLAQAGGEAIILMDSDLQDDPAALPRFVEHWRSGYDVVYAVRTDRKEQAWKRLLFTSYYRLLNAVSNVELPLDAGNFGLIDRCVLNCINDLPERDRYFPGLRSWVGFRQIGLPVARNARYDDTPRVSLMGLFRLAKTALFSFSNVPLSMFYVIGGLSLFVCGMLGCFALYHKLITGLAIPGWTSTTMVVSLFGAINSLGIAVLGEYATRIYDQVRARPNYLVARTVGCHSARSSYDHDLDLLTDGSPEARLLQWVEDHLQPATLNQTPDEPRYTAAKTELADPAATHD